MSDVNDSAEIAVKPDESGAAGSSLVRTLISLALFVGVYYMLFQSWMAVLALVTVIVIHESGHFIAMKVFGYESVNMTFVPFMGAYVSGRATNLSRKNKIIMLLAGPVPGIVIGCVLLYLSHQNGEYLYRLAALSFLGLNLFNLLPVYPLDGGQFFQALFFEGSRVIQLVFLYASMAAMLYFFYHFNYNWLFLLVAIMVGFRLYSVGFIHRVRSALDQAGINYRCSYDDLTDDDYWHIRTALINNSRALARKYDVNDQYGDEQAMIKHIESVLQPAYKDDLSILGKICFFLVWLTALVVPVLLLVQWNVWSKI